MQLAHNFFYFLVEDSKHNKIYQMIICERGWKMVEGSVVGRRDVSPIRYHLSRDLKEMKEQQRIKILRHECSWVIYEHVSLVWTTWEKKESQSICLAAKCIVTNKEMVDLKVLTWKSSMIPWKEQFSRSLCLIWSHLGKTNTSRVWNCLSTWTCFAFQFIYFRMFLFCW